ncbi:hypothetical protein [Liquorilactobacillus vini]|uniref:Uncharacterized protein n=1 Tax=Liquorilactobacillus vini DSM 20605 TaxID=1133569 RepID=A0A0R2CBJ3_9LACO|nr:hypothetical protein [Liquorilactobacillus vini]KRM88741.1 hypothetical protein FD21_GL000881 [Liquorilactobacillus vini DSM 20605]
MRKRTWFIVTLIVAVIFIGYGFTKHVENQKYYDDSLKQAVVAINYGHYHTAQIDLENALKKKKNGAEAKNYLNQLELYRNGLAAIDQQNYRSARTYFQKTAAQQNGLQVLVSRASSKQAELKEVLQELPLFKKTYQKAKILSTNYEYTASNTKLAVILGYGNIQQVYYRDIYKQAKQLKTYNDRILRKLGYNVSDDSQSSKQADDSFLPGVDSSANSSSLNSADLKKITAAQVKTARQDLEKEGVNDRVFSDYQIKLVIQEAKRQGVSVRQIAREFK